MPSQYQSGDSGKYESDEKKMLATKNDLTIAALIRGIRDPERAQAYIAAEMELAAEEDRDPRKDIIGACNRRKRALEDAHDDANGVDADVYDTPDEDINADTTAHDRQENDNGGGDGVDDAFPDADRFDDADALQAAVDDHAHDDVFTTAKEGGTLAGCFKCESHIGFVPKERDGG